MTNLRRHVPLLVNQRGEATEHEYIGYDYIPHFDAETKELKDEYFAPLYKCRKTGAERRYGGPLLKQDFIALGGMLDV